MGERVGRQAVDWSVAALIARLDTPTLRILAGLQEPLWWSEVEDTFFKTVQELGIAAPATEQDALWTYASQTAQDLLDDRISPEAACNALYGIWVALDYPSELQVWNDLDSAWIDITEGGYPYTYEQATTDNSAELCKSEARALLLSQGEG